MDPIEISDTSSDSSSDETIINEPFAESSELDNLLNKYLNDDYIVQPQCTSENSSIKEKLFEDSARFNNSSNSDANPTYETNDGEPATSSSNTVSSEEKMNTSLYELDEFPEIELSSKLLPLQSERISSTELIFISSSDAPNSNNKEMTKLDKEIVRNQKLQEKEKKKEEERKNKALKSALANHYKNLKPENCLKFLKVHIEEEISRMSFFEEITSELTKNSVSFSVQPHSNNVKSIISWTRQINSHILDTNGQIIDTSKISEISEILYIIECNDFIKSIHDGYFLSIIENLNISLGNKKIILAIYGLERYYRFLRNQKNQNLKENISGKTHKSLTDAKLFKDLPHVSRRTVEYSLTEIQLLHSISHRMVETKEEIALLVFQLTKAIAQAPYKLQKQEQFSQSKWFMSEDKKNCIRVDKNGNGLSRLWKQMITTFPLASLETAEAISAVYPTPLKLFEAYERISSEIEGEKLLQEIPIRRNAGPISTMRKVGPEMSKRVYHFFTSIDPDKLL